MDSKPYIIAVDFDGCLAVTDYPTILRPIESTIRAVKQRQADGAFIILWTCRCDKELDEAVEWCRLQGLVFDSVNEHCPWLIEKYKNNTRKIAADEYWDDKAARVPRIAATGG